MTRAFASRLLPLLRVPPEPTPPWGAPGSARVFRAGRNYYRLRLLVWSVGQVATFIGIVVSLSFLAKLKHDVDLYRTEAVPASAQNTAADSASASAPASTAPKTDARKRSRNELPPELERHARSLARRTPWWLFPAIGLFEVGGILLYLLQLPITYAIVRLEFEQRWYIVTDRSLRIRSGLVSVQETTMSFANVQQVTVSQGPLQRMLAIADVQVRSAGGGGGGEHEKGRDDSMHTGIFHGVDNATEIRDLILERLRQFRAAGLGDPDDHRDGSSSAPAERMALASALPAARELLAEARALRSACDPGAR